jgi:hypothetical protein
MNRRACYFVELSRFTFEDFVCQPTKEHERADGRRQAEQE